VIDMSALQMWLAVLIGWWDRQEREALAYLIEENRVLRAQLGGRRLLWSAKMPRGQILVDILQTGSHLTYSRFT
jgi:hypothetical protein